MIKTLTPLDPERKAFRLLGGVLVERTVAEVLPSVKANRDNLDTILSQLKKMLDDKSKQTLEFKEKYNIKTQEEAQQQQMQQQAA